MIWSTACCHYTHLSESSAEKTFSLNLSLHFTNTRKTVGDEASWLWIIFNPLPWPVTWSVGLWWLAMSQCHKHHNVTVMLHTCTSLPVCKLSSFTFTRLSQFTSHLLPNVHMIKMLVFFSGMAPRLSLSLPSLSLCNFILQTTQWSFYLPTWQGAHLRNRPGRYRCCMFCRFL